MLTFHFIIVAALAAHAQCQRGSFAGKRPIGFPELLNKTTTTVDPLGNRFGEGTTERLPLEANGDRDLVDRISKWPIDKQPFWYLNWKALEERRKNPQTYPQRPSQFAETPNFNTANSNTETLNSRFGSGTQNSNFGSQSTNTGTLSSNFGTQSSNTGTLSSTIGIPNSNAETLNAATDSNTGTTYPEVPSLGNGGIEATSDIGDRKSVNNGFPMSGYGQHWHNRYGA